MGSENRQESAAANIDVMMERLGIDLGYGLVPQFGLAYSCALRTCSSCTAPEACTEWLSNTTSTLADPPKFCPNADLLWELLCEPAIVHSTHSVH